jgi:hypothetical protein
MARIQETQGRQRRLIVQGTVVIFPANGIRVDLADEFCQFPEMREALGKGWLIDLDAPDEESVPAEDDTSTSEESEAEDESI